MEGFVIDGDHIQVFGGLTEDEDEALGEMARVVAGINKEEDEG